MSDGSTYYEDTFTVLHDAAELLTTLLLDTRNVTELDHGQRTALAMKAEHLTTCADAFGTTLQLVNRVVPAEPA